jgi:hypothetical protein
MLALLIFFGLVFAGIWTYGKLFGKPCNCG